MYIYIYVCVCVLCVCIHNIRVCVHVHNIMHAYMDYTCMSVPVCISAPVYRICKQNARPHKWIGKELDKDIKEIVGVLGFQVSGASRHLKHSALATRNILVRLWV